MSVFSMATLQVEANSLSDITHLAANPPKYPRNPTERIREPLSLYISRVPGSQDLILAPLKPQPKNVTAEDIASSLYYFHLNTEADAELLATSKDIIQEEDAPDKVIQKPLPRKPVPETIRSSLDIGQQSQVDPQEDSDPISQGKPPLPKRKPIPPAYDQAQPNESVQRRPLGPRPLVTSSVGRNPFLKEETTLKPNGREDLISSDEAPSPNPEQTRFNNIDSIRTPLKRFSITIIRRDPSSGAQWNVGTLVGEEQREPNSPHTKRPYIDITVHLSTPGYGQFRDPLVSQNYDRNLSGTENGSPRPNILSATNRTREKLRSHAASSQGFVRELCMEGSSFWTRAKQHKRAQSDISDTRGATDGSNNNFIGDVGDNQVHFRGTEDSNDSEPKGYVFTSPWGGRCKFSTSSGGKSLRCRHTLPNPVSAKSAEFGSQSQDSAILSELRFNLPSATVFSPKSSSSAAKALVIGSGRLSKQKLGNIRNKLSPEKIKRPPLPPRLTPTSYAAMYPSDEEAPPMLPPRPPLDCSTTESSDEGGETHASPVPGQLLFRGASEDESRLDLSIGQERAGGGNRGKRAKLGKLIIYNEGFKMLDLIVAANMGVWWSVWGSG